MIQIVPKHTTYALTGMLDPGDTLIARGGTPGSSGAVLVDSGPFVNDGTIELRGGHGAGAPGATLVDTGTLTNVGLIEIGHGRQGGQGAVVDVAGGLYNSGTVDVQGDGRAGHATFLVENDGGDFHNSGALLIDVARSSGKDGGRFIDAGVLTNTGTIVVGSLGADEDDTGRGGTLDVSGMLDNSGSIAVGGSYRGYYHIPYYRIGGFYKATVSKPDGRGALLAIDSTGTLVNTGTVSLLSSRQGSPKGTMLDDAGVLDNAGVLTLDGGSG